MHSESEQNSCLKASKKNNIVHEHAPHGYGCYHNMRSCGSESVHHDVARPMHAYLGGGAAVWATVWVSVRVSEPVLYPYCICSSVLCPYPVTSRGNTGAGYAEDLDTKRRRHSLQSLW